jgi:hypothetical protein
MMDLSCGRGRSLSCEREPPEAAAGGAGPGGCTDIGGWGKQSILEGERRQARRDETRGDGWGEGEGQRGVGYRGGGGDAAEQAAGAGRDGLGSRARGTGMNACSLSLGNFDSTNS